MVLRKSPTFRYRGKSNLLPWTQTAFPMDTGNDRKLLMRLPDGAKLLLNGVAFVPNGSYLVDPQRNAYAHLKGLDAAVASENAYACDSGGEEIAFSYLDADHYRVVSYEEALDLMEKGKTS